MVRLDAATVLLQWATGGLLFLWVTSRRREVGIGYGWLLRAVYGVLAATAVAALAALAVSVVRRKAGVAGERARRERRAARVRAMVGDRAGEAYAAETD